MISLKSLSINTINYELLRVRAPTQEIQAEHNSICMSLPTGVTNVIREDNIVKFLGFCVRTGTFIIKYRHGRVIRYCCVTVFLGRSNTKCLLNLDREPTTDQSKDDWFIGLLVLFIGAWMRDGNRDDSKGVVALRSYPSMPDNS